MPVPPPDDPISDPLLRPESAPRDAAGRPVRAPLGNSIRTLLVFVLLVVVGVAVWWWRRPDDLTTRLGGREWVITEVDGEPATNGHGFASTFVLDGTGEIRGVLACNVASGSWTYRSRSDRLDISWETQTTLGCAAGWPQTYLPASGEVGLSGGALSVDGDTTRFRAISLADLQPAGADDIAGTWVSGGSEIEIGLRGLFRIDECRGTWSDDLDDAEAPTITVEFDHVVPDSCQLDPRWRDETPIVPVLHDGVLYLRRDRPLFPLDRDIVRLDPPA